MRHTTCSLPLTRCLMCLHHALVTNSAVASALVFSRVAAAMATPSSLSLTSWRWRLFRTGAPPWPLCCCGCCCSSQYWSHVGSPARRSHALSPPLLSFSLQPAPCQLERPHPLAVAAGASPRAARSAASHSGHPAGRLLTDPGMMHGARRSGRLQPLPSSAAAHCAGPLATVLHCRAPWSCTTLTWRSSAACWPASRCCPTCLPTLAAWRTRGCTSRQSSAI